MKKSFRNFLVFFVLGLMVIPLYFAFAHNGGNDDHSNNDDSHYSDDNEVNHDEDEGDDDSDVSNDDGDEDEDIDINDEDEDDNHTDMEDDSQYDDNDHMDTPPAWGNQGKNFDKDKKIQEFKDKLASKRHNFDKKMRGFLEQRFVVIINRFEMITNRLQARIDFLSSTGKDTTVAQNLLNKAKDDIENFKIEFQQGIDTFRNSGSTDQEVILTIKAGRETLKAIKLELKQVLFELKGLDPQYVNDDNEQGDDHGGNSGEDNEDDNSPTQPNN